MLYQALGISLSGRIILFSCIMNNLLWNFFETVARTKSGQKHLLKKLTPAHLGTRGFLAVPPELSVETNRSLYQVRETSP
jgi:hypothetical protein